MVTIDRNVALAGHVVGDDDLHQIRGSAHFLSGTIINSFCDLDIKVAVHFQLLSFLPECIVVLENEHTQCRIP